MEFVLQDGMMIKGFTEGLLFKERKRKSYLLIPSILAYGPGNPQSPIPPYSPLIFEIEILSVK
jgi:peptidylprolyl isomerase